MSEKGFTLTELMVVMLIMVVLIAIGVPSYNGYRAKARRQEGVSLLVSYFTMAQGARGKFGFFPGNIVASGYRPKGGLGYRLRVVDNVRNVSYGFNDDACITTENSLPCTCAGQCPDYKTWNEGPEGELGNKIGPVDVDTGSCGGHTPLHTTDTTFVARVAGVINSGAAEKDSISINERKDMAFCTQGIY